MALSGISTFTLTRDDVIKASLRLLRELGAGAVPTIEDYLNCNQAEILAEEEHSAVETGRDFFPADLGRAGVSARTGRWGVGSGRYYCY